MDDPGEKRTARLHEIGMLLDRTDPRENPPYRNQRRKLNRERDRLLSEKEGGRPIDSVGCGASNYQSLKGGDKGKYREKRQVCKMMDEIEKCEGPKWWEKYK